MPNDNSNLRRGRVPVREAVAAAEPSAGICVKGWVRTLRRGKGVAFAALNDGSCFASLQVVLDAGLPGFEELCRAGTGACLSVTGDLVESPASGQSWELQAKEVKVLGEGGGDYPLQKKRHGFEYLRSIAHLRPRSNTFGAVFRVRSALAYAVHRFFRERGFLHVHTPIVTANDCEGAGEMFRVTTLDPVRPPMVEGGWTGPGTSSERGPASRSAASCRGNSSRRLFLTSTPSAPPSAPRTATPAATSPSSG
nr:OB-fold nucleic acid binding domain-containing protein [Desulfuromonas sp.]